MGSASVDAEEGFMLTRFTVELLRRGSRPQLIPIAAAFDNGHEDRRNAIYALDDHDQSGWVGWAKSGTPCRSRLSFRVALGNKIRRRPSGPYVLRMET